MTALNGYKTYIAAVAIGVATALQYAGIISQELFDGVIGALTALGLVCARVGAIKSTNGVN